MVPTALSPAQVTKLKGFSIALIVLHNFLHNVEPTVGENQFVFRPHVRDAFVDAMAGPVSEWPRLLISYYGHYAVAAFVLLSAYGLGRRYSQGVDGRRFLARRLSKVYVPFVLCVGLFLALWGVRSALSGGSHGEPPWFSLGLKLALVSNLVPFQATQPVGPWWFLPFIMQCYLLFPVLVRLHDRGGDGALVALSAAALAFEAAFNDRLADLGLNLNHTPIGHLAVFCLGLALSRRPVVRVPPWFLLVAAGAFVVGSIDPVSWLFTDIWAAILLVAGPVWLGSRFPSWETVRRGLDFAGGISLPLFLVNGFLRSPLHDLATTAGHWAATLGCAVGNLALATCAAMALRLLDGMVRRRLALP